MKLPLGQLKSHLARGLSASYLVAADEPLLVAEATDEIRRAAKDQGFDERSVHFAERGFRWESLTRDADNLSLFAARRIVEIRLPTPRPGDDGARAIRALAENPDPDRIVIVAIQSKLDRSAARSVWVKTVEKHGVAVEIRPVMRRDLPAFLRRRAERYGLRIDAEATELLADRVEGNLLAANQELIKLALVGDRSQVDAAAVLESVASSARFDVFRLGDAVVAGDLTRAMTVLEGLRSEGIAPPLVLWALVRELLLLAQLKHGLAKGRRPDELMRRLGVWRSREPALRSALERFSLAELERLMQHAVDADRAVKGLDASPVWETLTNLVLEMLAPRQRRQSA